MADDLTSTLAEAKRIADGLQSACILPGKTPDFTACGGPAAEAYRAYFTPARITALLGALERHMNWFTAEKDVRVCGGCLMNKPCPDELAITGEEPADG
jgi:hypothetical protein